MDAGARADDAAHLLVEEHRHLGRLHAALGDVVGVVEGDRQVLARDGGAEQPDLGERAALRPRGELGKALGAGLIERAGRFGGQLRRGGREVGDLLALDQAETGRTFLKNRQSLIGLFLSPIAGDRRQLPRAGCSGDSTGLKPMRDRKAQAKVNPTTCS